MAEVLPVRIWEIYYNARSNGADLEVGYIKHLPVVFQNGEPQVSHDIMRKLAEEAYLVKGVSDLIVHPLMGVQDGI